MAAIALEEKINKIKLQNEEIKRRHEEVEADKKHAAELNALVQMVPSSDWPERKEPPEFSNSNKAASQPKTKISSKEHYHSGMEGKVMHKFAEGDGPPPDPKYNFLADSERDVHNIDNPKDEDKKKDRSRYSRGGTAKKRGSGRDTFVKQDYHPPQTSFKREAPEYEAWRAERNRIDEARISRQKTAEGSWRREWDNNKIVNTESARKDTRMKGDDNKRDFKDYDKRFYHNVEYSTHNQINDPRMPHSPYKNIKGQDTHRTNAFQHQNYSKTHDSYSAGNNDRSISGTNRNMKITVNQGLSTQKGPVMSVKVNSPSIVGTGRVGPRQKTKVTYSTVSEGHDKERLRFFDDKHNGQKPMPYSQRKKDPLKNDSWKNDKGSYRKDGKDMTKSLQREVGDYGNVPKWSGVQGRIERVRTDDEKSVELNRSVEKTVDVAIKSENENRVISEAEQFHLNNEVSGQEMNQHQVLQHLQDKVNKKIANEKQLMVSDDQTKSEERKIDYAESLNYNITESENMQIKEVLKESGENKQIREVNEKIVMENVKTECEEKSKTQELLESEISINDNAMESENNQTEQANENNKINETVIEKLKLEMQEGEKVPSKLVSLTMDNVSESEIFQTEVCEHKENELLNKSIEIYNQEEIRIETPSKSITSINNVISEFENCEIQAHENKIQMEVNTTNVVITTVEESSIELPSESNHETVENIITISEDPQSVNDVKQKNDADLCVSKNDTILDDYDDDKKDNTELISDIEQKEYLRDILEEDVDKDNIVIKEIHKEGVHSNNAVQNLILNDLIITGIDTTKDIEKKSQISEKQDIQTIIEKTSSETLVEMTETLDKPEINESEINRVDSQNYLKVGVNEQENKAAEVVENTKYSEN